MQSFIGQRVAIVATQALSEHIGSTMDHSPSSVMNDRWPYSVHLIIDVLKDASKDACLDMLYAVKLTQPITEPICPRLVEQVVSRVCKMPGFECASGVKLSHYIGGSQIQERLLCCIVFGGDQCGWTVERDLETAIRLAHSRAAHRWPAQGTVRGGQTVLIKGLPAESKLNGELGIAVQFENDLWIVRLLRTSQQRELKPINLEGMEGECGRVFCYWGHEFWTRTLLLSGISGDGFVTCMGNVGDLAGTPEECWKNAIGRYKERRFPQSLVDNSM
jgi:hypothetical protein